ncbi:GNAT family N-acetyltransferase [Saccharomonospora halophila]|uniref:GNAT family N-acetyltransferase n=1 Tax=Saccharomonospora halophila TaxID=129922 RepID=UPI00048F7378|nr:GNAT family N-acetyltransferase [Saccharomonospora halophila]
MEHHAIAGPPLPRMRAPWSVRPAEPDGPDLDLIHDWMHTPHVVAFWNQDWTRSRWAETLRRQRAGDHSLPCLVSHDDVLIAYLEVYRVARDRLADHYPHQPGDLGVHVAIGAPGDTGRGLGRSLLREVADGLLATDPACGRVVAEPDVRNVPSVKAFRKAGFRFVTEIDLPEKTAALMVRSR